MPKQISPVMIFPHPGRGGSRGTVKLNCLIADVEDRRSILTLVLYALPRVP